MRKKILIFMTLFAGALVALADNTVSVDGAQIPQGKSGTFSIELANTDAFASSMEIHLTLPEGITFESVALSDRFTDNPTIGSSVNGQAVTITTLSTTNAAISGNSGPLFFVTVSADADLEVDETLTASFTKIELAKKVGDGHEKYNPDPFDFEIVITNRVILDENSSVPPAVQSGVNVLVKRTVEANKWSTIVLPFRFPKDKVTAIFGSDAQFADFASFETDYGDNDENMKPLGIVINLQNYTVPRNGIPGGKPLLVNSQNSFESFEVDNVSIINTMTDAVKEDAENGLSGKLTGTYVKTNVPADGLFISDDLFWYSTGKTKIKAFRCWFELDAVLGQDTNFGARVTLHFDNSELTGVSDVKRIEIDDCYYDMQGRKVEIPMKGLYIRNGRKEVVR